MLATVAVKTANLVRYPHDPRCKDDHPTPDVVTGLAEVSVEDVGHMAVFANDVDYNVLVLDDGCTPLQEPFAFIAGLLTELVMAVTRELEDCLDEPEPEAAHLTPEGAALLERIFSSN